MDKLIAFECQTFFDVFRVIEALCELFWVKDWTTSLRNASWVRWVLLIE